MTHQRNCLTLSWCHWCVFRNILVLVLLFVALWFILRGDFFYVLPCVILFLYFSVFSALRLPRLGKRELILVLFVRLFDFCLFEFVGFLFLLLSEKGWFVIVALPGLFSYLFFLPVFKLFKQKCFFLDVWSKILQCPITGYWLSFILWSFKFLCHLTAILLQREILVATTF